MPPRWAEPPIQWDLYRSNATELDADGFLIAQPDYPGGKGGQHVEVFHPYGFYSRQLDAATDKTGAISAACPMLVAWHGGEGLAFLGSDLRAVPGLAPLQPGESLFYGPKANFFRCLADGSLSMVCTSDGTGTGQTIQTTQAPTGHLRMGPWGKETFDVNGWHLRTHSGARIDLGGIGNIPAPLDQFANYAKIAAASIDLRGSIVSIGPTGVVQDPIAKSTPMLILATAIQQALVAVNALAAAALPTAASTAAATAATAALATLAATLTGAQTTIPATSATVA